jgi:hypothetical protein
VLSITYSSIPFLFCLFSFYLTRGFGFPHGIRDASGDINNGDIENYDIDNDGGDGGDGGGDDNNTPVTTRGDLYPPSTAGPARQTFLIGGLFATTGLGRNEGLQVSKRQYCMCVYVSFVCACFVIVHVCVCFV